MAGVTLREVNTELDQLARRTEQVQVGEFEHYEGWSMRASRWSEVTSSSYRVGAFVTLAAVGFVLLLVCANSATLLRRPELHFDGVRIGLALHGVAPENTPAVPFRPILSLKARVARLVDVPVGGGASYGLTWRARVPSRLALIPIGYADGWRRSLGNRGTVLLGGQRAPIVGRVCMDQFLVDVTHLPPVSVGDEVYTGGRTGRLPYPMYYGRVTKAELKPGAPHWEIEVQPAVTEAVLKTVHVLREKLNPERVLGE